MYEAAQALASADRRESGWGPVLTAWSQNWLKVGEEGALRVLALVPELFPIEMKTPPTSPFFNAFAPLELDPAKKGTGVTLDPSAPLRVSGTNASNQQPLLAKKGFTVGAATVGFGYFEVGGGVDEEVVCLCALMSITMHRLC